MTAEYNMMCPTAVCRYPDTSLKAVFTITESVLMVNPDEAKRVLQYLKSLGVKLSIDEFGTGYSSLVYLKRFSLDALKIDALFVRDIVHDADDATITRTVNSGAQHATQGNRLRCRERRAIAVPRAARARRNSRLLCVAPTGSHLLVEAAGAVRCRYLLPRVRGCATDRCWGHHHGYRYVAAFRGVGDSQGTDRKVPATTNTVKNAAALGTCATRR